MTLQQILKSVSSQLPSSFDRENIAAELWLGAWQRWMLKEKENSLNHTESDIYVSQISALDPPLSNEIIHNRCVDEIRKKKNEKNQRYATMYQQPLDDGQRQDENWCLDSLLMQSQLTRQAQLVIMEKFFLGSSLKLIAEHLMISPKEVSTILEKTLERLRAVAREARNEVKE